MLQDAAKRVKGQQKKTILPIKSFVIAFWRKKVPEEKILQK
jgi:hypothetical protein